MPTVRFSLNEEHYAQLQNAAQNANMSIQDYIRFKIFDTKTIFSVDEAVKRIQAGNFEDRNFTLPDVYGDDWTMTKTDGAGSLGKAFNKHILEHPELGIRHIPDQLIDRRHVYTYHKQP